MLCLKFGVMTPRQLLEQMSPEDFQDWVDWYLEFPFGDFFILRQIAELHASFSTAFGGFTGESHTLALSFTRRSYEDDGDVDPYPTAETIKESQDAAILDYMRRKAAAQGAHTIPPEYRERLGLTTERK